MKNVSVGNIGQIDFANTGQCPIIIVQSPSNKAQLYLPQVTPRVPRSVHAKFHADQTKTVVRRGILRLIYRVANEFYFPISFV